MSHHITIIVFFLNASTVMLLTIKILLLLFSLIFAQTEIEDEEHSPDSEELLQEYEDLHVGLIANRYQRTLARRVENGKVCIC